MDAFVNNSPDSTAQSNSTVLTQALQGQTAVLVGQSGVGKSSIINSLSGQNIAKTGNISDANIKGKHTTTTSQLYPTQTEVSNETRKQPSDNHASVDLAASAIIDSPGIREFGLWHLTHNDIINGLPEFRQHANQCQFRDCEHGVSKGCALQRAIDDSIIHPSRVASYRHILNTMD